MLQLRIFLRDNIVILHIQRTVLSNAYWKQLATILLVTFVTYTL